MTDPLMTEMEMTNYAAECDARIKRMKELLYEAKSKIAPSQDSVIFEERPVQGSV